MRLDELVSTFDLSTHLMLPWDDRAYDEHMPLTRIRALLPYHSHVDPETVASALNRMIDEAAHGRTVFYRFYSEAQRQQDPARDNTGLFFFRGSPGAPFAVVSPGGGFSYVGSVHEGFPHAAAISGKGYNAFVLKYRAGHGEEVATRDLAAAVTYVFRHAETLGVGTDGYSLWRSSAGARMAAAIGSHGVAKYGGGDLPKPSAVVMAYTGHSDYASVEPPTFVVAGGNRRPRQRSAGAHAQARAQTRGRAHRDRDLPCRSPRQCGCAGGWAHLRRERSDALSHYRKALALNPDSAIARVKYARGLLLLDDDKQASAKKLLAEAAKLKPCDATERLDVELAKCPPRSALRYARRGRRHAR